MDVNLAGYVENNNKFIQKELINVHLICAASSEQFAKRTSMTCMRHGGSAMF